jgi:transposase-like protein
MPEHVLMSEIEIITDGGRRRRWSAAEKLRIVEETLDERASISVVTRRNGVAPNLLAASVHTVRRRPSKCCPTTARHTSPRTPGSSHVSSA